MFAQIEGTARYPIDTSRSLDTRGVAAAKPQLFPPYSTTLCVVIYPWAAFPWPGTSGHCWAATHRRMPFFLHRSPFKKRRELNRNFGLIKDRRREATEARAPSKFRATVGSLHHDKGNHSPTADTTPVENSRQTAAPSTRPTKTAHLLTRLDLKHLLHNKRYQTETAPLYLHQSHTPIDSADVISLTLLYYVLILSTPIMLRDLDTHSVTR